MQSSNAAVRLARWVSRWRGSSSLSAGDRSSSSSSGKQKEEGARDTDESMLSDDDDVDESDGIVGTSMLNYYLGAPASISLYAPSSTASSILDRHPAATLVTVLSTGWLAALFFVWPFPTTVHAMLALVVALLTWTALQWAALVKHAMAACLAAYHDRGASIAEYSSRPLLASPSTPPFSSSPFSRRRKEWSRSRRLAVFAASMLSIAIMLNAVPPREASTPLPPLIPADPNIPEKYLIAANLYNNEEVFGEWSTELVHLCRHLGEQNVFISIAESNSKDGTKLLLSDFDNLLTNLNIPHRITLETNSDRSWPYGTSPERISYLAAVRNKALEPIQSDNESIRLSDAESFTKVVFLNDIYFSWQSIVRLLATRLDGRTDLPSDYDLACAFDYGESGMYDTWVARDICGAPMRSFWPYVKDPESIKVIKAEKPIEVGACWNGAVAFPAEPHIRKIAPPVDSSDGEPQKRARLSPRGWRMMDNSTYSHSLYSPPVPSPVKFRGPSYKDACDHSEAFFFSYDIHRRLKDQRAPRIIMNPAVKVAYSLNWYRWRNTILQVPFIRFWQRIWSHGPPFWLVDWIFERAGRRSDYCTWAGLQIPDRCPPIARPIHRGWDNG